MASVARPQRGPLPPPAIWIASALVLVACLMASFRQEFAADLPTAWVANGPRVLFGAAAGALLGLAGALRLQLDRAAPLEGLAWMAVSAGVAGGGFAAADWIGSGPISWMGGLFGAVAGGVLSLLAVGVLDRPRRATNFGAALLLAAAIGAAALAGSYARARTDAVAPAVAWLLGDLSGATFASGGVLSLAVVALVTFAAGGSRDRVSDAALLGLAWFATGLAVGAAGVLAFVSALVPVVVRGISGGDSRRVFALTCALAAAATVAAIDAVPRLLVGGYDFPFNVPAGIVAIPFFLFWNRARLRRVVGRASSVFETLEVTLILAMTLAAALLASVLARVIDAAT